MDLGKEATTAGVTARFVAKTMKQPARTVQSDWENAVTKRGESNSKLLLIIPG
jgi:hypothetical protein